MYKKIISLVLTIFLFSTLAYSAKKIVLPADKGPKTINISKYPKDIQNAYYLFSKKCSQCHTLARPLNTTMAIAKWDQYTNRMMHKPNSKINEKDRQIILSFLKYDQINRKDKNPKKFCKPVTIK